jgi:hypothetical protein
MGTSRPKPDAPPASPLIPPWADKDPVPPAPPPDPLPEDPVPESEEDPGLPADEVVDGEDDSDISEIAEPRRFAGFRTALSRFAGSSGIAPKHVAEGRRWRVLPEPQPASRRKPARWTFALSPGSPSR